MTEQSKTVSEPPPALPPPTLPPTGDQLLRSVEDAINGLEYGCIVITVHAAKVVQLEVTRKQRFPA